MFINYLSNRKEIQRLFLKLYGYSLLINIIDISSD